MNDTNVSGQLSAAYRFSDRVNAYATYATSFKSVGLNLNGVPADATGQPVTWALSYGGEYSHPAGRLVHGELFVALDGSYRSSFSSSATPSRYLMVDGYPLLNMRIGFRSAGGWTLSFWARNLFDRDYFELLTAAPGNTGLYVGQPAEGRTVGMTFRHQFSRP